MRRAASVAGRSREAAPTQLELLHQEVLKVVGWYEPDSTIGRFRVVVKPTGPWDSTSSAAARSTPRSEAQAPPSAAMATAERQAGDRSTSSTESGPYNISAMISALATAAAGDMTSRAPAATRSPARPGVRFPTVSGWPPRRPGPLSPRPCSEPEERHLHGCRRFVGRPLVRQLPEQPVRACGLRPPIRVLMSDSVLPLPWPAMARPDHLKDG